MHSFTRLARKYRSRQTGFTLIELMVAVIIIAILSVIAVPAYQDQMRKARRSDAKTTLLDIANRQEKFFSNTNPPTYTTNIEGDPGANPPTGLGRTSILSPDGYYRLTVAPGATGTIATSFIVTATAEVGKVQQYDTQCTSFSISSTGVKTSAPAVTGCW